MLNTLDFFQLSWTEVRKYEPPSSFAVAMSTV